MTPGGDDTTSAYVHAFEQHAEFESSRVKSAQERAGALVAVIAAVVTLSATQARETFARADQLGALGQWVAAVSLVAGLACFVAAAAWALYAAKPSTVALLDDAQLLALKNDVLGQVPEGPGEVASHYGADLVDRIIAGRKEWATVRFRLRWALRLLIAGLACIVVHVTVYAARTVAAEERRQPLSATTGHGPRIGFSHQLDAARRHS
jgi:hypothetical protein